MLRLAALTLLLATSALAREQWPGQWASVDPATGEWFRSQRNPKTNVPCCSEADGAEAQEDVVDGHYRVRFVATRDTSGAPRATDSGWMDVAPEAVLTGPNRNGAPVAWWYWASESGVAVLRVRCFAPGAKL